MKSTILLLAFFMCAFTAFSQEDVIPQTVAVNDTVSKTQHMIGLNVFPAFGILGGGMVNNSKIALQYKMMTKKINFRMSINYLNYYRNRSAFDIVGIVADTTLPATADDDTIFQSMKFRSYYNQVNTYDFRAGVEYAIEREDIRFYVGLGGIVGLHNIINTYHFYYKPYTGYPIENVGFPYDLSETAAASHSRATSFLKLGADLSLGVDFRVAENCVVALQYTPEFAYYKWLKDTKTNDIDNVFDTNMNSFWVFSPDFIDLIIYIKF